MNFAKLVKLIREKLFLTQEDLAKEIQTTSVTISRWESGTSVPRMSQRRKIVELCRKNNILLEE